MDSSIPYSAVDKEQLNPQISLLSQLTKWKSACVRNFSTAVAYGRWDLQKGRHVDLEWNRVDTLVGLTSCHAILDLHVDFGGTSSQLVRNLVGVPGHMLQSNADIGVLVFIDILIKLEKEVEV